MDSDQCESLRQALERIAIALEAQNESIKRVTFAAEQLERFRTWINQHVDAEHPKEVRP